MNTITLHYRLTRMYHKGELITIDSHSYNDYIHGKSETLEHKIDGVWIDMKPPVPVEQYRHYSHGISPRSLKKYYGDIFDVS